MSDEKILLVYPTLIKPGLPITAYMTPDPILVVNKLPTKCALYITTVFTYSTGLKLTTEIDIQFEGKSILAESDNAMNSMDNFMFSQLDDNVRMFGARFYIQNANIETPGNYDVIFRLYENDGDELGTMIEEKTCAFIAIVRTGNDN